MKRDFSKELEKWKNGVERKPLLIRGARQVGKSWIVKQFAATFPNAISINFEKDKGAKPLFDGDIHIQRLLEQLSLYAGKKIIPGQCLLFLDEIQECESAITALRYFKEDCPELHVIAAGSLIEFALARIGVPVGRIQFLHLYPASFGEFLMALDRDDLRTHLSSQQIPTPIHVQLLNHVKTYLWLGGMPAVMQAWLDHKDVQLCQRLQDEILQAYRQDFLKYAKRNQTDHVSQIFDAIPAQLGKKFTYSHVNPHIRAQALKQAMKLLEMAGVAIPVYHTSAQGLPLGAAKNEKRFKTFFLDVGLAQRLLGLDMKHWITQELKVMNIGAIAEQFTAQELLAYSPPQRKEELYYWHREAPASNAEVDFVVVKDREIVPVEVKSGVRGGIKSMSLFLESHPASSYGVKISENPFSTHGKLHEVPLYGIESWLRKKIEGL
jgi:predicted AAA+ superfamily ATPase